MHRVLAALLVLVVGVQPALLHARQVDATGAQAQPLQVRTPASPTPQTPSTSVPDIEALGLSFDRIKRLLADRAPSQNKSPLKLNYYVEVVALAPTIELFTREELAPGAGVIPWGPPTHADIVRLLTPIEFRSPRVDVSSLAILGIMKMAQWEAARVKRYQAEQERLERNEAERRRQKALEDSGLVIVKSPK